ncbi:uncharacterized protein EI90DRAFT_1066887 [Cantharellus anzutake]|uniref:uncharacterized protein n=1 Tax=Cantharellus anzutake TaxID=1750568 RepID=UPI0019041F62|nr:uncharacterized protein EI90DRAFT_1066887 [Cantharellus anzutake]KAF8331125.1 hypothetical protein EI90DRAFT_1066887 [Cantharellus anzutake]
MGSYSPQAARLHHLHCNTGNRVIRGIPGRINPIRDRGETRRSDNHCANAQYMLKRLQGRRDGPHWTLMRSFDILPAAPVRWSLAYGGSSEYASGSRAFSPRCSFTSCFYTSSRTLLSLISKMTFEEVLSKREDHPIIVNSRRVPPPAISTAFRRSDTVC